jgi:hypothetical protein
MAPDIAQEPVAVARDLLPLIRQHADDTERECRPAAPVVDALRSSGLCSMGVPAALGGFETPLIPVLQTIEEIGYADGATGWNGGALVAMQLIHFEGDLDTEPRTVSPPLIAATSSCVFRCTRRTAKCCTPGKSEATALQSARYSCGIQQRMSLSSRSRTLSSDFLPMLRSRLPSWRHASHQPRSHR